jgi:hypothetical protein
MEHEHLTYPEALKYLAKKFHIEVVEKDQFPTIMSLKDKIVDTIESYLDTHPELRPAPPGESFYFMRSITFILPTPYKASNLTEFWEALQKISLSSLYFHIFEARLRLERKTNDFSTWLEEVMGERQLAAQIASIDPYTYTLEGLRIRISNLVQKRLKELGHA